MVANDIKIFPNIKNNGLLRIEKVVLKCKLLAIAFKIFFNLVLTIKMFFEKFDFLIFPGTNFLART